MLDDIHNSWTVPVPVVEILSMLRSAAYDYVLHKAYMFYSTLCTRVLLSFTMTFEQYVMF